MKIKIVVFCLIILSFSCQEKISQSNNESSIKDSISTFIDKWHEDAANFNHESYISAMSNDGVYIGTDADENWTTQEFKDWSKPYFEKKHTWNFKKIKRNVYLDSKMQIAWFDELLETAMGICRGSGVLILEQNNWKIKQYVLSATIPNEIMRQVIDLKHQSDSLLILKLK